jgi:hypothetical protein
VLHWAHAIRSVFAAAVALVVISSSALAAAASHLAAPEPKTQPGHAAATTTQNHLVRDERRQDATAAQAEVRVQAEARQQAAAQRRQAAQQQAQAQQAQQAQPNAAQAAPAGSIPQIIQQAFTPLGPAAVRWALMIARRESNFDPRAENPSGASGLFQFMPSTFAKSPPGQAGKSIWDPVANAEAAAWMYAQGRQNEWSTNY